MALKEILAELQCKYKIRQQYIVTKLACSGRGFDRRQGGLFYFSLVLELGGMVMFLLLVTFLWFKNLNLTSTQIIYFLFSLNLVVIISYFYCQ